MAEVDHLEMAKTIAERTERTSALLEAPNAMAVIEAFVQDGGSLPGLCELWNVRHSDILRWINADKERQRRYVNALNDRTEWVKESILQLLREITFRPDIRSIIDKDGSYKPIDQWPEALAKSILSLEIHDLEEWDPDAKAKVLVGQAKKVKFIDPLQALDKLGKNLSMFTERHEITHKVPFEQIVGRAHRGRVVDVVVQPPERLPKHEGDLL